MYKYLDDKHEEGFLSSENLRRTDESPHIYIIDIKYVEIYLIY